MTFSLYFGGGDSPAFRKRLLAAGVTRIAINFTELRNRLPKSKEWLVEDHFPADVELGLYWSPRDWLRAEEIAYANDYRHFAEENHDRLSWVTTFHKAGPHWAVPMWDEKTRPEHILQDAPRGLVAITGKQLEGRKARSFMAGVRSLGGSLLGVGVSDPQLLPGLQIAASSSWVNVTRYGEFVIWDGARLRRFNAKTKVAQRPRYRNAIRAAGVDYAAVLEDDKDAVTALTLWSWQQMEMDMINRRIKPRIVEEDDPEEGEGIENPVTRFAPGHEVDIADIDPEVVAGFRRSMDLRPEIQQREQSPLPLLSIGSKTMVDADGAETVSQVASFAKHSLRNCNSCAVADSCPAYKRDHECAYTIPIEVRTKDQLTALLSGVLEMQAQRVAFTRMAEELGGGYPDPNLSSEMDRLFNMTEQYKKISDNRDFINIQVEAKAQGGILSRLFGDHVGEQARALPSGGTDAASTDEFIQRQLGIVDAEVVEEDSNLVTRFSDDPAGTAHTHEGAQDA